MNPSLSDLTQALRASWPVDSLSYVWPDWNPENPARGQCVPSALVVQDYVGGDIARVRVRGEGINETHYYNVLEGGTVIDTTRSQYVTPVRLEDAPIDLHKYSTVREKLLSDTETNERYKTLKQRVQSLLRK